MDVLFRSSPKSQKALLRHALLKRSMNNVLQMSGWPSLHYRVAAENMWTRETTRQTETQTEKRVFVLVSTCWLITQSWASDDHRLWLPVTQINPEGPLSTHQRKRGGFHGARLNWVCALIINTSQTLSLSAGSLQGYWQTHRQISDCVCVYPQPSISGRCCEPSPGVGRGVFYDGAGLECPSVTHPHYHHLTNTHRAGSRHSLS